MRMLCKIIVLLVIVYTTTCSIVEEPVDFSQHKLIQILPKRLKHLNVLEKMKSDFNVDFWNNPMSDLRPVLTLLKPEQLDFLSSLNKSKIKYEVRAHSFQKLIDAERYENERNRLLFSIRGFDYNNSYHSYDEIIRELKSLSSSKSDRVIYKSIGTSTEGREIPSITITNHGGSDKRVIFLECGIHAREWISPATCLWIINRLLTDSTNNKLLEKFEFIIVPSLNPDGYVYTHTTDRMWRKTKSRQNGRCFGADPNRNWDSDFCRQGASKDPCNEAYCGPSPFSEIEARSMANLITTKKNKIAAYFALHSFSQLWMYPYGYTKSPPRNSNLLNSLSTKAVSAIRAVNGLTFKHGPISTTIYPASGSSIDWAYDKCNATIAFALELRDTGSKGFLLPANQINAAASETWAGIRAVITSVD